jgi:hypothetical protein
MTYPWAAGEVLTAADLNNYAGLVLVKSQTIGSGVSSVTVTNAFSSTFENYLMTGRIRCTTASTTVYFQFTGITGGVYKSNIFYIVAGASGGETNSNLTASTVWDIGHFRYGGMLFIGRPNAADFKMYSFPSSTDATYTRRGGGRCESTTQATGFTITPATGTFNAGNINIYGFNDG